MPPEANEAPALLQFNSFERNEADEFSGRQYGVSILVFFFFGSDLADVAAVIAVRSHVGGLSPSPAISLEPSMGKATRTIL